MAYLTLYINLADFGNRLIKIVLLNRSQQVELISNTTHMTPAEKANAKESSTTVFLNLL